MPSVLSKTALHDISASSAKPFVERPLTFESESSESTPTPRYYTPPIMEPSPITTITHPSSKAAPALGLLPTPRLTPQNVGFNTPAVSAASYLLGKASMGYAMAQVSAVCAAQTAEKWPSTSSPQQFSLPRRSSLANSVSSMSSPESMISDSSSRSSRRSSISSASSLMCAPTSSKLDIQARCRYAKQCCDRQSYKMTIATVPEFSNDVGCTSSPDSYAGRVGKDLLDLSLETPLGRRENDDYFSRDSANDAARALQDLHNHPRSNQSPQSLGRAGAKRSRPASIDHSLQDNVREMLAGQLYASSDEAWSESLVRSRSRGTEARSLCGDSAQAVSCGKDGRKRVCCSTEAVSAFNEPGHLARPGMWKGILN